MRSRPVSRGQPSFQPCIAELLRTCVYPPTLILRVEKILEEEIKQSRLDEEKAQIADRSHRSRTYRLYLSDGEIMIQALLATHLHSLVDLQETTEGSLIELRDYTIQKARRLDGKREIIYLGVRNFVCISLSRPTTSEAHDDVLVNGGGFMIEEEPRIIPHKFSDRIQVPSSPLSPAMAQQPLSSQESCAYETIIIHPETVRKRRQALHELSSKIREKRRIEEAENDTPIKRPRSGIDELASSQESAPFETVEVNPETAKKQRQALCELSNMRQQRKNSEVNEDTQTTHSTYTHKQDDREADDTHNKTTTAYDRDGTIPRPTSDPSAPLYKLDSLIHPSIPLPTKNYTVTILAVISWISPTVVHRPGSPFPPKRILKLHDPSITNRQVGVSISVFIDAATFTPRHSTIALFTGVVMQMYRGEVILNAYASLSGTRWYVDNEEELEGMGYDVQGMRDWWEERKRVRASVKAVGIGDGVTMTGRAGRFPEHIGAVVTRE